MRKKLKRAGNLVEHHRIKGALHGYFALGIEHLYVQESFQYNECIFKERKTAEKCRRRTGKHSSSEETIDTREGVRRHRK